mgnify:CR=1 FL=1
MEVELLKEVPAIGWGRVCLVLKSILNTIHLIIRCTRIQGREDPDQYIERDINVPRTLEL